jgi:ferredoxin-NADP reductase
VSSDRYHPLTVRRVVSETADAISIVFDVPDDLAALYTYRSGQFVTLRVVVDDVAHLRSYSMSSAPDIDDELQVTVKRVPAGPVSSWLHGSLEPGDVLDVSVPAGAFGLADSDSADAPVEIVAFAAGSGITPIISMVKSALHSTDRRVRLLFANQDRESVIFAAALNQLEASYPGRLSVHHHRDDESGYVDEALVASFLGDRRDVICYLCGPGGFMDVVQAGLSQAGVPPERIQLERFTPPASKSAPSTEPVDATDDDDAAPSITITVGRETKTVKQRDQLTILESARWSGLPAPSSCEAGHCATCMAQVLEGEVSMRLNDILTETEVEEGWVLTCQTVPLSPVVRVVYDT